MKSILLIIPYFGRFNNYFPFFLKSCENNPTVNWLIFTDDDTSYNYPSNVKVVYTSLNELKEKIQKNFDFPISLESPYKLCDYKPVYGKAFAEYVQGYDFWGYCDTDLIFGDIRGFITDDVLKTALKVLSRGHLSLFRNNDYMNNFVLTETDGFFKKVYTSPKSFAYDEWGPVGIANNIKRKLGPNQFWDELPFDDLSTIDSNFIPAQKRNDGKHNVCYEYCNGKLNKYCIQGGVMHKEQVLYAHFQKRYMEVCTTDVENYTIIPNKFIPHTSPSLSFLKKNCGKKIINLQLLKIKWSNLKRRIKL